MITTEKMTAGADADLRAACAQLEGKTAPERVDWALEQFGEELVLSTSFGIQSAVMLHLVTQRAPGIAVVFIDTGYLFAETYQFAEMLQERLKLNLKVYQPEMTAARQEALFGKRWEGDLEALAAYNMQNKVEPMNRAIRELGARAWLTGLRRVQAKTRAQLPVLEQQKRTYKVHPIIDWSERDIYQYLQRHQLPFHPLWDKGYVSVGDWHSTQPLTDSLTPEQTRFGGLKRECGLHESNGNADWQI